MIEDVIYFSRHRSPNQHRRESRFPKSPIYNLAHAAFPM
jgi:hypothetical protein